MNCFTLLLEKPLNHSDHLWLYLPGLLVSLHSSKDVGAKGSAG
jgi:hypothetical protein